MSRRLYKIFNLKIINSHVTINLFTLTTKNLKNSFLPMLTIRLVHKSLYDLFNFCQNFKNLSHILILGTCMHGVSIY